MLQGSAVEEEKSFSCRRSGDADGIRASKVEHVVEDLHGDGDLSGLRLVGVEAQAVADDALPAPDLTLHASPHIVAAVPLPSHPAALVDRLDVAIALGGCGLGGRTERRIHARWHDHFSPWMALVHIGVDAVAVVGSCMLMLLFLYAMVEAQAIGPAGPEVAEASDGRLGIGE